MALGFCPAILLHLRDIALNGYPGDKVTRPGFTQYLYTQTSRPTIQQGFSNGHRREVRIKYAVRATENYVNTTPSCDVDLIPAFKEVTQAVSQYIQHSIFVDIDTVRQYCEDASRTVMIGQPPTETMAVTLEFLLNQLNGLYQKMDKTLLTLMALNFGKNKRTGSTAAAALNFPLNGTENNLQTGFTQLIDDTMQNEFCDRPTIVGSGNFNRFNIQMEAGARSFNQSGVNEGAIARPYNYFFDPYTEGVWGSNQIGVFDSNSVHIVEDQRNVGSFAGPHGADHYGIFMDPRTQCWNGGRLDFVKWDMHVRYVNCPETATDGYAGGEITLNRGTQIILSKYFDLFTIPSDAYDGADVIAGQNGTLRYQINNA